MSSHVIRIAVVLSTLLACAPAQPHPPEPTSGGESVPASPATVALQPSTVPATETQAPPEVAPEEKPQTTGPAATLTDPLRAEQPALSPAAQPQRPRPAGRPQPSASLAPTPAAAAKPHSTVASLPAAPASSAPPPAAPPAESPGRVQVELAKLESDDGRVQATLFRTAAGFPRDATKAAMRKLVRIHNRRVDLVFENVPPGMFAVAVHHDENGDSKMQTGLFGIPTEGFGASRDASGSFGPPSFDDARLKLAPGEHKRIVINVRY